MGVFILNSGRCSHGKCFFCGYGRIRGMEPITGNVIECLRRFFDGLDDTEVKVFGSGSFLDEKQVPSEARKYFIKECRRRQISKVYIESIPEYVNKILLEEFEGLDLTVAMGLESADDMLLLKLDKDYGTREYVEAANIIHECGFKVRTYLLVNLPFVEDVKKNVDESVEFTLRHSDSVVLINLLPHANAPLNKMWVDGEWNFLSNEEFNEAVSKWRDNPKVELDAETFKFIPSFREDIREDLTGVGEWYLIHPHFEVWQDYLVRWYTPTKNRILLFLPCTRKKPYSQSNTHRGIIKVLEEVGRHRFHEVMISNAGVIPREFEDKYPFNSYDWDERLETKEVKDRYIEVISGRIRNYLTTQQKYYQRVVCFLKYESESYQALKRACESLDIEFKNLLNEGTYEKIKDDPRPMQTNESLRGLREGALWCLRNST